MSGRIGIVGMQALLAMGAMFAGGAQVMRIGRDELDGDLLFGPDEHLPRKQPPPQKREPAVVQKPKPATPDTMTRQRRRAEERAAAKSRGQS